MSIALIDKRRAYYAITEASAGTYEAPTQSGTPDVPIHIIDATWSKRGGVQPQEQDVSPYAASVEPIMGPIAWEVQTTLRVPVHPDPTDDVAIDLAPLLVSCPGTLSDNTGSGPTTFSPTTSFVSGTDVQPCSITDIQDEGNVRACQLAVGILESCESSDGVYHTMTFRHHGQMRDTLSDSVEAASGASLTASDAFGDYLAQSYASSKGGTLTITNLAGSAAFEVFNYSVSYGMSLEETLDQTATHGYGCSVARYSGHPILTLTVPETRELATSAGRQWWGAYFGQTALGATSLSFGASGSTFIPFSAAKAEIINIESTTYNGRAASTITIAGQTSSGDDAFTIQWGA